MLVSVLTHIHSHTVCLCLLFDESLNLLQNEFKDGTFFLCSFDLCCWRGSPRRSVRRRIRGPSQLSPPTASCSGLYGSRSPGRLLGPFRPGLGVCHIFYQNTTFHQQLTWQHFCQALWRGCQSLNPHSPRVLPIIQFIKMVPQ